AAARHFDAALALAPENPEALLGRGVVHSRGGEYAQAIALLRRARPRTADERAVVLHHLGQALVRAGSPAEAEAVFDELNRVQTANLLAQDARYRPDDLGC